MRVRPLIAMLLPLVASAAHAATLVVLEKSAHRAALVDPATLRIVARLATGRGPHEAAPAPGGGIVYVTNYGGWAFFQEGKEPKREAGRSVTVLDLAAKSVRATWDLGVHRLPHGIAVSRDGSRAWVTTEGTQSVHEIDTASGKIVRTWSIAQHVNHMVVPARDEAKLYVANIASGSVTVLDRDGKASVTVPTGAGAEGIDLSPDGRELWVANRSDDSVSVLDTRTTKVVATFPSGGKFPIRVRFAPDGKSVWISNANDGKVAVFDHATRKLLGTIDVPETPIGIVFSPDGARAFVACAGAGRVVVLDTSTRTVSGSIDGLEEPDGMAWAK